MTTQRVTLAHPWDVLHTFDPSISQAQLDASNVQDSGDDIDYLKSLIEDAESEFHEATDDAMKIGTVGSPGQRETYEQPTYKISGHKTMKGTFTGVWTDYLPEEKTVLLEHGNVVPFDPTEGDELYVYRGLQGGTSGQRWEDITDKQGSMWAILNHSEGRLVFSPIEVTDYLVNNVGSVSFAAGFPSFLKRTRFAVRYRYGSLGGSRGRPSQTTLDVQLNDSQTDTVAVVDGSQFPSGGGSGSVTVLIDDEYLAVDPDPGNDEMEIVTRGVRGTDPEAHDSGASIYYTPPAVRKAVAARAGMALWSGNRYDEFLPNTEANLDTGDVISELEQVWESTVASLSGSGDA